jgi:hypothetical protein
MSTNMSLARVWISHLRCGIWSRVRAARIIELQAARRLQAVDAGYSPLGTSLTSQAKLV